MVVVTVVVVVVAVVVVLVDVDVDPAKVAVITGSFFGKCVDAEQTCSKDVHAGYRIFVLK